MVKTVIGHGGDAPVVGAIRSGVPYVEALAGQHTSKNPNLYITTPTARVS